MEQLEKEQKEEKESNDRELRDFVRAQMAQSQADHANSQAEMQAQIDEQAAMIARAEARQGMGFSEPMAGVDWEEEDGEDGEDEDEKVGGRRRPEEPEGS